MAWKALHRIHHHHTNGRSAPSLYSSSTSYYYCSLLLCTDDSDTHAMLTSDRQTHLARSMKKLVISAWASTVRG